MTQTSSIKHRRGVKALAALLVVACAVLVSACGEGSSSGSGGGGKSTASTVKIVAFKPPSLGAFLPAVIEARKLDAAHGLNMQFTYTTPDNYQAEFSAGHFDVGGSGTVLEEALRTQRGIDVTYLFNLFNYFGAVVTSSPQIRTLTDLSGHTLAAATGTTNYAMFEWFAKQQGLDLSKVKTVNQTTAGLSTMALTGRTDATELWEPAYSSLLAKKPDIRTLNMGLDQWSQKFHTKSIPYLGVAAQRSWADKHPATVKKLYAVYKEAATWVQQNPAQAAQIIAKTLPSGNPKVIENLIKRNQRLGLAVAPASQDAAGIRAAFQAGRQTGYLKKEPPATIIYKGLGQ